MTEPDPAPPLGEWSEPLAAAWERFRDRLFERHRKVSDWLVGQIDPQPGQTILELGAGPGETGFLAAERVGAGGKLISTDLGPAMVAAARRGAAARGLANVECRVMDARQIDLADHSVDGVICRFGLMLMPEPGRAVTEVRRVLRPGGRFAYAVWGPPDRNPWVTLLAGAVRQAGHQPSGDPFGPGGLFSLASPGQNHELLDAAGFSQAQVQEVAEVISFDDFDDFWDMQSQVAGSLALLISSLPAGDTAAIRAALKPALAPFQQGVRFELPSLAVVASASPESRG